MTQSDAETYGAMMQEVEGIIEHISNDGCDLDTMVGKVERGYTLIRAMREIGRAHV